MSANRLKESGFVLSSITTDGKARPVVRFHCARCPETVAVSIRSDEKLNPEAIVGTVKRRGWNADPIHASRNLCPKCIAAKPPHDPDVELKRFAAKGGPPMITERPPEAYLAPPSPPSTAVPIREATADQRAQIRSLLEKHFDEDEGCYLDDWSDARIAEQVNLPRLVVERLREVAYGAIKITPENKRLREELTTLRVALKKHMAEADALLDVLAADQAKLAAQINDLAVRLGMEKAA